MIFFRRIYDRLPSSSPVRLYTRELTRIGPGPLPARDLHSCCIPAGNPGALFRQFPADPMLTELINKNDRNGHPGIHLPLPWHFLSCAVFCRSGSSLFSSPPSFLSAPLPFASSSPITSSSLSSPIPSRGASARLSSLFPFPARIPLFSSSCPYPPSTSLLRTLPFFRHAKRSGGSTAPAASHRFRVFDVLLCGLSLPLPVIPPRRAPRVRTASCPGCSGGPSGQPLQPPGRR